MKVAAIGLLLLSVHVVFVGYTAFLGWWMQPIAEPGDVDGFAQQIAERVEADGRSQVALLLVEDGEPAAEYYYSSRDPVNADTVFAVASISKWLTATAVMKLVQDGAVDLDTSVSHYLTRWQLPNGAYDNEQVTPRRLLSHTAGLTDGLGFGDYGAQEEVPPLELELANPRASSGDAVSISVGLEPGSAWQYSGGGYLLLQLLVEEVTGQRFSDYMQEVLFAPLGMHRTSYRYLAEVENNAGSYDGEGEPAPVYRYASDAATGLITSTTDLMRFVLAQIPQSGANQVLHEAVLRQMRAPHGRVAGADIWGLGTILYAPAGNGDYVFGHDGATDPAINSTARINPASGDAIVVLATGGSAIASEAGAEWVLWQTGYPDVLNFADVIRSMYLPGLLGLLILGLLFAVYVRWQNSLRQRAMNSRLQQG